MTVGELIEALQKFDPNLPVVHSTGSCEDENYEVMSVDFEQIAYQTFWRDTREHDVGTKELKPSWLRTSRKRTEGVPFLRLS